MARRSVELAIAGSEVQRALSVPNEVETELRELEKRINGKYDRPISVLLSEVIDRICPLTRADGAAIAVRDPWGLVCRASAGNAPDVGSRLQPDSALTRECFETGTVVVCEDTESDFRIRSVAARSLRLRSAVVVPILAPHPDAAVVEVLGLIEVLSSRPFAFDTAHIDGLKRVAELLAPALAPAPPQESEENILAAGAMVAPPEEPKSKGPVLKGPVLLVAGVVLLSLLLLFVPALFRRKPLRGSSTPSLPPASTSGTPAQPPLGPRGTPSQAGEAKRVEPNRPLPSEASAPKPSSPSSISSPAASPKPAAAPPESLPLAQNYEARNQAALAIRPAAPALVILGIPPGSRIFVDDQLVASTNPSGQASISMLPAGQHRLHLALNGYRDFDQAFDVQPGKTSTVTAKLEPLELPTLSGPATAPILAVSPAVPPPVTPTRPSVPDFVLNRTLKAHSGWVTGVAFSPDGQRLASGSWDRTVKFWQVSSGEQLSAVASKMKEVQSLAFSRDGHWLATENSSDTVALRDPTTGQEMLALPSDKPLGVLGSTWVYSIAFSPDGQWLASGVDDKTVRLWDVKTGRKVRDLTGLPRRVIYIAFSPDGRLLATGDDDKTIRIWDVSSGEQVYKLSGHKRPVYAVAFSPNGHWLASASADKTVKLWDLTVGREVRTLSGHENVVTSLAFSPDGRWLVSGSWDKTIRLWDVEAGRELQALAGHDHPVYSLAFDPRGNWLASGSEDGTIKLWRLTDASDHSKLRR
jgi:WD40 repeat protein